MKPLAPQTERNQEYLKANGWRLVTSQRAKYGVLYYWDHPDHQRRDGRWWTQGDAVHKQKVLDRAAKVKG